MSPLTVQPISPELVLVDPDLRARIAELPLGPVLPAPVYAPPAPPDPSPNAGFSRVVTAVVTFAVFLALPLLALASDLVRTQPRFAPANPPTNKVQRPATVPGQTTQPRGSVPPPAQTLAPTKLAFEAGVPPSPAVKSSVRAARATSGYVVDRLVRQVRLTQADAKATFGQPSRLRRREEYCRMTWSAVGLTLVLTAPRGDPCLRGQVVGGVARGSRWRTANGLHSGASLGQLRALYPAALDRGAGWWQLGSVAAGQSGSSVKPLHAHVHDGRVDRFLLG